MKKTAFDKVSFWGTPRSQTEKNRYLILVKKLLDIMEKIPKNNRGQIAFLSHLQVEGVMPPGKRFLKRLLLVLIPRYAGPASRLLATEILDHGTRRFSLETILGWLDEWASKPYDGGLENIPTVLDALRRKDISVPKDKVIHYCKQLADRFMFRDMGNLLLDYKLHNDQGISNQEVYEWALRSAEMNDHGISRVWTIFLDRAAKKKTYLDRKWIKAMATVLHVAYTSKRSDRDFIVEFLLQGAHSHLRYRSYKSLLYQYRKMLVVTHREMRQEMEKDLVVGNCGPRNYRGK